MIILIWSIFLPVLLIYCLLEKQNTFIPATTLKVILSAYVALTAFIYALPQKSFISLAIAMGLLFAVPADFFLQYIRSNIKKYRWGILFFGAMHVCLLTGYYLHWGISWIEFVVAVIMLVILSLFQKKENWNLGKTKTQLSIYTVLVVMMAAKSISIGLLHPEPATISLAIGGLLFFVSDIFLGIWDYYDDKFIFLALNRIIYFVGQLLIAQAIILM